MSSTDNASSASSFVEVKLNLVDGFVVELGLEAMACQLPVIGTLSGGPPSFINVIPGEPDGWLVPPDDETALADAMVTAVNDPAERARRGTETPTATLARTTRGDTSQTASPSSTKATHLTPATKPADEPSLTRPDATAIAPQKPARRSAVLTSVSLVGEKSSYHSPTARKTSGTMPQTTSSATWRSNPTVARAATGAATTIRAG